MQPLTTLIRDDLVADFDALLEALRDTAPASRLSTNCSRSSVLDRPIPAPWTP